MDLESDDGEARSRKHFDDPAWPEIRELKIIGLDQDERFFDLRVRAKMNGAIQDSAVGIRKFRPEFQITLDCFWIENRKHARLEVSHLARIICDVIAVGVANCFTTRALVHDVAYGAMNLFHRVRSAKDEEQHTRVLAVLFTGEIFQDVLANQLLRRAMTRIGFRHDRFGVALG